MSEIREMILPPNHPNRPMNALHDLYAIVIHYTNNEDRNMTAINTAKWFAREPEKEFRFGCTHYVCDSSSIVQCVPDGELTYHCGDAPRDRVFPSIRQKLFRGIPNFYTIGIEICNNDIIQNSDDDWFAAVQNAQNLVKKICIDKKIKINKYASLRPELINELNDADKILLLRHHDITGKLCPKPMVDSHEEWVKFVSEI